MATKRTSPLPNTVVKSRPPLPAPKTTLAQLQQTMPPASPAQAPTLRQVIADLQLGDPGGVLKAQLKALLV